MLTYVLTTFVVHPNWVFVLRETFLPAWPTGHEAWAGLVAILGATISPYLFFWQASLEWEEKRDPGRVHSEAQGAMTKRMSARNLDVAFGTLFSNLVMYFIILTAALTLYPNNVTNIETSRDAAAALTPLAGAFAATLFTFGIVGGGLVAIPTLITSAAYALAETFRWNHGLSEKFEAARPFYGVIILASVIGIALDLADVSPMKALFWAAIVNGLIAPFLLVGVLLVASDRKVMRDQPCSRLAQLAVGVAALAMFGAGIGMFVF